MISSDNTFIRIGEIPKDKRSTIYYEGVSVGKEDGLSVYETAHGEDLHDWRIVLSKPINSSTIQTLTNLMKSVWEGTAKVYLMAGKRIGTSSDGTPLIDPIAIVEDVTKQFRELPDLAKMRAHEIEPNSGQTFMDLSRNKLISKEDDSDGYKEIQCDP